MMAKLKKKIYTKQNGDEENVKKNLVDKIL